MARLETTAIAADTKSGYIVINESDFDPSQHTRWTGETEGKGKNQNAPEPEAIAVAEPEAEPAKAEATAEDVIAARATELEDTYTVAKLEPMAANLNIEGYSSMKKAELARAIAEAELSG